MGEVILRVLMQLKYEYVTNSEYGTASDRKTPRISQDA